MRGILETEERLARAVFHEIGNRCFGSQKRSTRECSRGRLLTHAPPQEIRLQHGRGLHLQCYMIDSSCEDDHY